jgi:hypothetical protein
VKNTCLWCFINSFFLCFFLSFFLSFFLFFFLSRHTSLCHATPLHATPCYCMPCHTPCHASPSHATPHHATPCHAMPHHATPRHTTSPHATAPLHQFKLKLKVMVKINMPFVSLSSLSLHTLKIIALFNTNRRYIRMRRIDDFFSYLLLEPIQL